MLPLIAALLLLFTKNGLVPATFLFGLAAILLFLVPEFTSVTVTILGNVNEVPVDWSYGIGLIFAMVLSIIGLSLGLVNFFKKA